MTRYDYRVVPAPERGEKARGVKAPEARFAHAVEQVMNDMAAEGWEYLRSDTLPSVERSGLTASDTVWRNLLVFRRPNAADLSAFQPKMLEPPLVLEDAVETPEAADAGSTDGPEPAQAPQPVVSETEGAPAGPDPAQRQTVSAAPARPLPDTPIAMPSGEESDSGGFASLPGALLARAARMRNGSGRD